MSASIPRTILLVHNNNDMYGAEVILLELLRGLDRKRFDPIVVLPSDTKHINRLSTELEKAGIEYYFIRMAVLRRKYFNLLAFARLVMDFGAGLFSLISLIFRRRIDLVHTNTASVICSPVAARLTGRKHIWHVHEIIVDPIAIRKFMHFMVCRLSDVVVTVSEAVRKHILLDCPTFASKITVVHNGIEPASFTNPQGRMRIRDEFGVPPEALLIGMVGRVCRWKGQLEFAETAKLVLREWPHAYFLAVGGVFDNERQDMERFRCRVDALGLTNQFFISDFRTDIPDILAAMDIFVLPSTQPDPFPTVILEAMRASKPVIATAHGGPLELVAEGQTVFLVAPSDSEALAHAILKMVESGEGMRIMGENGRVRFEEFFETKRFISNFESVYEKC